MTGKANFLNLASMACGLSVFFVMVFILRAFASAII